jgi:hypothetical protein
MGNESGRGQTRYGLVFILAALAVLVWLVVHFAGKGRSAQEKT